ncbi:hypothetical protein CN378_09330 [Bacillus sp. AFS015802]|uniref:sensor domain-containing diguanylate cyclase n=1 Tax=Bacillus sp. AFS015802 TaxID=2033486 RepID=UPI000BF2A27B|nr:sensor domain-containing diguanylate cyclase [Bacillus sp. AFS015802]PFA67716.1 hypothetical protein CN378_09330 [Bacillus sp. AFS015802]
MDHSRGENDLTNQDRVHALTCMSIYQCGREERYDRITRIVKEVFKVDICQINLLTDREQLFKSSAGLYEEERDVTRSPVTESMCQYVINGKTSFVVEDTLQDPDAPVYHYGETYGIRFYAGVGLKVKSGHVIGTLCIVGTKPRTFSHEELDLLLSFGKWVTTEIELQEELKMKESREAFLKRFHATFTSPGSINEKQMELLHALSLLIGTEKMGIYYWNHDDLLFYKAERELPLLPDGELRSGMQTYLKHSNDKGCIHCGDTQVHLLPIVDSGKAKGCFFFAEEKGDTAFSQRMKVHEDLLNMGTEWMNMEFLRMESHLEIQRLLRTDELTQLKNRKALHEDLLDCDVPYALLFLDIDQFKRINDTYGHSVGDFVLREIGSRLNALKESHEVACYRISGDEFVLLVKNEDQYAVEALAENVLSAFSLPFAFDMHQELFVGVSIGVSVSSGDRKDDFKSVIQRADRSMYQSKRLGGNRFTID